MVKKKRIVRVIYRDGPEKEIKETFEKTGKEIKELEEKKTKLGKGFRPMLQRMAINREINEKAKLLKTRHREQVTRQEVALGKQLVEKEKLKAQLKELRSKSAINFENPGGSSPHPKPINYEDLFR